MKHGIHVNLNRFRAWIARRLSLSSGYPVCIHGNLAAVFHRVSEDGGWRAFIPRLQIIAHDIVINAPSPASGELARIGRIDMTVRLFPLLLRTVELPSIVLNGFHLQLKRNAAGSDNWNNRSHCDGGNQPAQRWKIRPGMLVLKATTLQLEDDQRRLDCTFRFDSVHDEHHRSILQWRLSGSRHGDHLTGQGSLALPLLLGTHRVRHPIEMTLRCGDTRLRLEGSLHDPFYTGQLDGHLTLTGPSMAHVFSLTGIVLPETRPFVIEGPVAGSLTRHLVRLCLTGFKGTVGKSAIDGTLEYTRTAPRPALRGEVHSACLHADDLRSVLGMERHHDLSGNAPLSCQPPGKCLPSARWRTERWADTDIDVNFIAEQVAWRKTPPIDGLSVHAMLRDGVLLLTPLCIDVASGQLSLDIRIDGQSEPAAGRIALQADGLQLKRMSASMSDIDVEGLLFGDASLEGSGNSIAALLGGCDGEIRWHLEQGAVSRLMMDELGLRLGRIAIAELFGDEQVAIRCAEAEFKGSKGLMNTGSCEVDTPAMTIEVRGYVDFASEAFALSIRPRNKGIRSMLPRLPLYLIGTFDQPNLIGNLARDAVKPVAEIAMAASLLSVSTLLKLGSETINSTATTR